MLKSGTGVPSGGTFPRSSLTKKTPHDSISGSFHVRKKLPSNKAPLRFTAFLMADLANKYPENITGKIYVDDQCIDCDLCRETAPANFKRNDDGGHSYLYKQPESDAEESLCKEAMEGCPVEAIGNDGV